VYEKSTNSGALRLSSISRVASGAPSPTTGVAREGRDEPMAPIELIRRIKEGRQEAQIETSAKMAIEAKAIPLELEDRTKPHSSQAGTVIAGYWALTKPDVNLLVAVTVGIAFCLASTKGLQRFPVLPLLKAVVGTGLITGGSGALNQYLERRFDARMRRTSRRPLASGALGPVAALCFGLVLSVCGALYLAIAASVFSAALAILACATYLFVYTPLKRVTPLCTLAGAFPGAVPPLIGWAAASGRLGAEAWVLYLLLFLWQLPHFMAIAWMYREDYARASYRVFPRRSARTSFMRWLTLMPLVILLPVSIVPTLLGYAGQLYALGAFLLSCLFLYCGVRLAILLTNGAARRLLFASIAYLPTILVLLMLDRS
jgi:protoheme IX farnesyltransferase